MEMELEIAKKNTDIRQSFFRRVMLRLATVVIGFVFVIAVVEIGLRVVGYSSPEFYRPDEVLGYSLTPGISGWYAKEGRSFVAINGDGFRDVEHSIEKPKDTLRIAVVGDSYVEGLQVGQNEIFSNFVRDKLSECGSFGPRKIEMLDFGVSGYGTAQELLLIRERVWKYAPDLVLLLMTTNNDISDNLREFKRTPIPYFVLENDGLKLDDSFRQERSFVVRNSALSRLGIWFKQHLRIVQGVGEAATKIKYRLSRNADTLVRDEEKKPAGTDVSPAAEVGIDNQVYIESKEANWQKAWAVTEAILLEMKKDADSHGARLVVVTGSNGVQVLPTAGVREDYAKSLGVADLLYPDRRIAEFCSANSIRSISLAEPLADYAEKNNIFLHGFEGNMGYGHWNQTGHRVAGEVLGARMCQ